MTRVSLEDMPGMGREGAGEAGRVVGLLRRSDPSKGRSSGRIFPDCHAVTVLGQKWPARGILSLRNSSASVVLPCSPLPGSSPVARGSVPLGSEHRAGARGPVAAGH